ncbi:hypothetical protein [Pseudomonas sp. FP1740]|uniref:hypothetical protein n=1 Tax=Pseudomonas sp. FP1740 TaxID=2954078 RepID=UPI00273289ED|nr:hypothetical protein [Pseudomonas sp. FP1740]WLG46432.1 hypothetical protein PSH69_07400 [Pseudomonas sp. FP1740]
MLRVVGVKEPSSVIVEFGQYVLLNVEFCKEQVPAAPFYWRVGNFVDSLVEIGLNRSSGAIAKVGLIAYGESDFLVSDEDYLKCVSVAGLPMFNIDGWPSDRYRDEVGFLSVAENEVCLVLQFSLDRVVSRVYDSCGVRFGVNLNDDLAWIAVSKGKR